MEGGEMTDEQINAIIATSLGFIEEEPWLDGRRCWVHIDYPNSGLESIPDFCNDLNACHEFESEIIYLNDRLPKKYTQQIKSAICREAGVKKAQMDFDLCITATARQRCEAYLRTLGKWIE